MQEFVRGQKSKLSDLSADTTLDVGLIVTPKGSDTLDYSCFGLDGDGKLSDDRYFIFYNNKSAPDGSVSMLGAQGGMAETFRVDLGRIPATIKRLVFTVTMDGPGTLSAIAASQLQLSAGGKPLARFNFSGADFGGERAVMVAEIYFKDVWRFAVVGQGFNGGLSALLASFGGSEVAPAAAAAPASAPAPARPAAAAPAAPAPAPEGPKVNLGKVTLSKRDSKHTVNLSKTTSPQPIHINLNWDNPNAGKKTGLFGLGGKAAAPDLDLGCMFLMQDGMKSVIQPLGGNFGSRHAPPFIYLDKDDRSGAASDGENLYITRPDLIVRVMVFALIYEGTANFAAVNGRLTLRDQHKNEIFIPLNNPDTTNTFCAICLIEKVGDGVQITKEERYFSDHRVADNHYGFGFRWAAGSK